MKPSPGGPGLVDGPLADAGPLRPVEPITDEEQEFHGAAVDAICEGVAEMQPEHFVTFDERGDWTVQHSMRCRLEGMLLDCPYTRVLSKGGSGGRRGTFVAQITDDGERLALTRA